MNSLLARARVRPTGSAAPEHLHRWILGAAAAPCRARRSQSSTSRSTAGRTARWHCSCASANRRRRSRSPRRCPTPNSDRGRGASAPLVEIPDEEKITAANAAGRIVVRPAPAGTCPTTTSSCRRSAGSSTTRNTIDPTAVLLRRLHQLQRARRRPARSRGRRRQGPPVRQGPSARQLTDHYEPYEGTPWKVPACSWAPTKASDRRRARVRAARHRAARPARGFKQVDTPTVIATIPGQSPQRIVIDSHTDGTNAVEDNGPVAMVAMARYLAGCRAMPPAHDRVRVPAPRTSTSGSPTRTTATAAPA